MTTLTAASALPTSVSAFPNAASATTAVPCWSSWKTGMSSASCSRASMAKHLGAAMSSRLIPPKTGATRRTVATISSASWVARQSGKASTPPKALKSMHLPSITGWAAAGPMLPSPSTADPSVTTATMRRLTVSSHCRAGSSRIARQTRPTPGV